MALTHILMTLRGDNATEGIEINMGRVRFVPRWGSNPDPRDLAVVVGREGEDGVITGSVNVAYDSDHSVVISEVEGTPERELVLVQEYVPGSGAKRYPAFSVRFGSEVRILSVEHTTNGSGSEKWSLVSAPRGWAQNIASQFVNERDAESQVIEYLYS